MSGSVVGGVVGVGISLLSGGSITPMWGWAIGNVIGAFAARGANGPRLNDLKVQASEYGRPIPIVYSIATVAPNIVQSTNLVEHGGSGGGKGGGGSGAGPTYTVSFTAIICEGALDGEPEMQLGRIWAGPEKRLIYDPTGAGMMESGSVTFYPGSETQLPDPFLESIYGVGNVPAFRGTAYIVVKDFDLSKDGNRPPFLTIEVGRTGTSAPPSLGTVFIDAAIKTADSALVFHHGSYYGVLQRSLADYSFVHNRTMDVTDWLGWDIIAWDGDRGLVIAAGIGGNWQTLDMASGALTGHAIVLGAGESLRGVVYLGGSYLFAASLPGGGMKLYAVNPATATVTGTQTFDAGGEQFVGPLMASASDPTMVYGATATKIHGYPVAGGASTDLGTYAPGAHGFQIAMDPSTGFVWAVSLASGGALTVTVHNPATVGVPIANSTSATSFYGLGNQPFIFEDPGVVWVMGNRWLGVDYYAEFDTNGTLLDQGDGAYVGVNTNDAAVWDATTSKLISFRYNGGYSVSTTWDARTLPASTGYLGGADASLSKQTLAEIVTSLSKRADLQPSQLDVTQIPDVVDGFVIGNQMEVREALKALMPAFYFDMIEAGRLVKCVKRGGAIAAVIPDDELGAYHAGDQPADPISPFRKMEKELPRVLYVNYVQAATAYSQGNRHASRQVGKFGDDTTMDFPIVMTDTKAQEVAEVNLHATHIERLGATQVPLPLKYWYLEPTDVIVAKGFVMRITKMTEAGGVLKCEAVRDDSQTYTPYVNVTEMKAVQQIVATSSLIDLELM